MQHQHKYSSGWVRGQDTYRCCIMCGQVLAFRNNRKHPEILKNNDYEYYKKMAIYYEI